MPYLNIDTEKGIIAHGTGSMDPLNLPAEPGTCFFEAWADGIRRIKENGVEYKEETLYRMEPGFVEDGYLGYAQTPGFKSPGGVSSPENHPFVDAAVFDPGKLHNFRVWDAKPNITVIKDGKIVARNVKNYDSRPLWQRPTIQKIGLGLAAATSLGLVATQTDIL